MPEAFPRRFIGVWGTDKGLRGERMAAQTAGLCVLSICLVLVWFQSNAVDPSYHRSRSDPDEAPDLGKK